MDAMAIVAVLSKVIKVAVDLGPVAIKTVMDAKPFAEQIYAMFKGQTVTQEQLDVLELRIDELAAQLQVPLPPEGAG